VVKRALTLEVHRAFWGYEDKPLSHDLLRLTPEEADLYDDLRDNRIREGLERFSPSWNRRDSPVS